MSRGAKARREVFSDSVRVRRQAFAAKAITASRCAASASIFCCLNFAAVARMGSRIGSKAEGLASCVAY